MYIQRYLYNVHDYTRSRVVFGVEMWRAAVGGRTASCSGGELHAVSVGGVLDLVVGGVTVTGAVLTPRLQESEVDQIALVHGGHEFGQPIGHEPEHPVGHEGVGDGAVHESHCTREEAQQVEQRHGEQLADLLPLAIRGGFVHHAQLEGQS